MRLQIASKLDKKRGKESNKVFGEREILNGKLFGIAIRITTKTTIRIYQNNNRRDSTGYVRVGAALAIASRNCKLKLQGGTVSNSDRVTRSSQSG